MDIFPLDLSLLDLHTELRSKVHASLEIVHETFNRWKSGEVGFSFNGGKDSVVLCALVLHVARQLELEKRSSENGESCTVGDVRTIFFLMDKEYPEMLAFMREFAHRFQLNVAEFDCSFKAGLTELVNGSESKASLPMKAMFMGTRRDDPNGRHQKAFCPTDPSWPALMRVNPILELQYHDIWTFIQIYRLPYCKMYDLGYTSIGTMDDTTTNERLWSHVIHGYLPPWRLANGHHERLGRGLKRFLSNPAHPHLLAYPTDILKIITSFLGFRDLARLHASGCRNLNEKLAQGVHTVRYLEKHDPNPQTRRRVTLGLESKFGDVKTLELDFSVETEATMAVSRANAFELDFTKELPKSLQKLILCNPCSAIPSTSSAKRELMSSSTEISPNTHGTLHTESSIDLPQLEYLCIQHQMPVAPFSLNRIYCPKLTHLEVGQFPLDLEWLATLTHLESLSFPFRPSGTPLSLPSSLTDLSLHHTRVSELTSLSCLPSGLTSLQVRVVPPLIESLIPILPERLLNLVISSTVIPYSESLHQLPPKLHSLALNGPLVPDEWTDPIPGSYPSIMAKWLSTLPGSLTELRLPGFARAVPGVTWGPGLRHLHSSFSFSETSVIAALPRNLETLSALSNLIGAYQLDGAPKPVPLNEPIHSLPPSLTHLIGFSLNFSDLPDLPDTLTKLSCREYTLFGTNEHATDKLLPSSLTELELLSSNIGKAIIFKLPTGLRSLVLMSEEGLEESTLKHLPRHLATLSVRNKIIQSYGSELEHLPPYLTHLIITPSKLSLSAEHTKRELLPSTLTHVVLGTIRVSSPI